MGIVVRYAIVIFQSEVFMNWKDAVVSQEDVLALLDAFSSSCHRHFDFFKEAAGGGDLDALRLHLLREAVDDLFTRCSMSDRQRVILKVMPPEAVINSIEKEASSRFGAESIVERIRQIKLSLSPSVFEKMARPLGADSYRSIPIRFWMQTGKGGVPYLRIWAGFRSFGARSLSAFPRSFLKEDSRARRLHSKECPLAETNFVKVSSGGRIHALSVEDSLRFFLPLSESQRKKYEETFVRSRRVNGERVRYALAEALHEIVCPLGIDLPVEPNLAGGLVKDASPLDFSIVSR